MRLRGRTVIHLALAGLLPLAAFGLFAIESATRAAQRTIAASTFTVATQVADNLGRYVQARIDVANAFAAAVQASPDRARSTLGNALLSDPSIRYWALLDTEGELVTHTILPHGGLPAHVRETARLAARANEPVVSRIMISARHLPVMAVAAPLNLLGEPEGVIVAEVETPELWALVSDIRLGDEGYAYVLDPSGQLIAHGLQAKLALVVTEESVPMPPVVPGAGVTLDHGLEYQRSDGIPVVGAAAVVPWTQWIVVVEMPTREAFKDAKRVSQVLVLILLTTFLALPGMAYVGARYVTRPIESLARAASELGRGRFDVRVDESRRDEIGDLGRHFNKMAVDLDRLSTRIRRHERESFFARIAGGLAHDLKRPLQHIITHVRTYLHLPDSSRARALVEQALDREQAYVDRLFGDLGRLSKDDVLEVRDSSLRDVLTRARDAVLPMAGAADVRITLDFDESLPLMNLDPLAMERAVRNVIENAVDAVSRRAEGTVHVSARRDEEVAVVEIRDDGPGIEPAILPVLFEEFRTTKRSGSGLGLGLAVVARITQAHGGSVSARNDPRGGAVLSLTLPIASSRSRHGSDPSEAA